jgi:hypothetical protein
MKSKYDWSKEIHGAESDTAIACVVCFFIIMGIVSIILG